MPANSLAEGLTPAPPTLPVAGYIGGKRNLARQLIERIGRIPHTTYAEPFVGMGGVFLRRPFRAKGEIINDVSADVVTLFRILQRHYQAFMDVLKWQVASRADFERLMQTPPETMTDLERAARFLYLQRLAFGGKVQGRNFGMQVGAHARFDVTRLASMLEGVHERLCGVVIERMPFDRFISQYDRPDTLFYLDPPYWGCEGDYGPGVFERADFERLAGQLASIKGRFILSLNDTPEVRALFARFAIERVEVSYSVNNGAPGRFGELIIQSGAANKTARNKRPGTDSGLVLR